MEELLIPAIVAVAVFMVVWMASQKLAPTGESQRKKSLLGSITEEADKEKKTVRHYDENVQLLKDNQGRGSFLASLVGVKQIHELVVKAGMWKQRYTIMLVSLVLFAVVSWFARKIGIYAALPAAFVAYYAPYYYLKKKIEKRSEKLVDIFPDSIDLIVRSVRSGHPINTALRMIAENMEAPVCEEFQQVVDEVSYGRTLTEALRRMSARLQLPDVDFFVVVLAVQQETGGSLTEVLTNLSNILRRRKQLRLKIKALTSEGRATSYILGAIPVLEFGALYYLTPSYLDPFFNTFSGNIMGCIAIALIIASQIVIRAMCNIDI